MLVCGYPRFDYQVEIYGRGRNFVKELTNHRFTVNGTHVCLLGGGWDTQKKKFYRGGLFC